MAWFDFSQNREPVVFGAVAKSVSLRSLTADYPSDFLDAKVGLFTTNFLLQQGDIVTAV